MLSSFLLFLLAFSVVFSEQEPSSSRSSAILELGGQEVTQDIIEKLEKDRDEASSIPRVFAFLIDSSSSISESRFDVFVRHAVKSLIEMYASVYAESRFFLATFSSNLTVWGDGELLTGSRALGEVSKMSHDGEESAVLSRALDDLYARLISVHDPVKAHIVVGGMPFDVDNPTEREDSRVAAKRLRKEKENIEISVFGLGTSGHDHVLASLASSFEDFTPESGKQKGRHYSHFPDEKTFWEYLRIGSRRLARSASILGVRSITCSKCRGKTILDPTCGGIECTIPVELIQGSPVRQSFVLQLREKSEGTRPFFPISNSDHCRITKHLDYDDPRASCDVTLHSRTDEKRLQDVPLNLEVGILDDQNRPIPTTEGSIVIANPLQNFTIHSFLRGHFNPKQPLRILVWGLQGTGKSEFQNSVISSCSGSVTYPISTGVRRIYKNLPITLTLELRSMAEPRFDVWDICPFEFGDTFGMVHSAVTPSDPIYGQLLVHRLLGQIADGYSFSQFLDSHEKNNVSFPLVETEEEEAPYDGLLVFFRDDARKNVDFLDQHIAPFLSILQQLKEVEGLHDLPILGVLVCMDTGSCLESSLLWWKEYLKDSMVKELFDADPYLPMFHPPGPAWKSNEKDKKKWIVMDRFQTLVENRQLRCGKARCRNGGKCLVGSTSRCHCGNSAVGLHCERPVRSDKKIILFDLEDLWVFLAVESLIVWLAFMAGRDCHGE